MVAFYLLPGPLPCGRRSGKAARIHCQQNGLLDFGFGRSVLHGPAHMAAQRRLQAPPNADTNLDQFTDFSVQWAGGVHRLGDLLMGFTEGGKLLDERFEGCGQRGLR